MSTGNSKFWMWVATGLLSLVLVAFLNLAAAPIRQKWDLTEDDKFTLPEAAREIAAGVDDTLAITCYVSKDLPGGFKHLTRVLRERLEEFHEASRGRIEFEFIDPQDDEILAADLRARKIEPVQGQDREEGRVSIGQYWLTMVFRYGDQEATLNLVAHLGGAQVLARPEALSSVLPYHIAARIVKVQNPDMKLGIVAEKRALPERLLQNPQLQQLYGTNPTDGLMGFRTQVESHFPQIQDVVLRNGNPVPDGIQTLILYRPENLSEREIYEIDQFLMAGKRVVLLLENFPFFDLGQLENLTTGFQSNELMVKALRPNLREWLAHYGVLVEDGYVADESNARIRNQQMITTPVTLPGGRQGMMQMPGPVTTLELRGVVVAREQDAEGRPTGQILEDSAITTGLGAVAMAYPTPMLLDNAFRERHPDASADRLIRTSSKAWVERAEGNKVRIHDQPLPAETDRASRDLVLHLHGSFRSFFAGKDKPKKVAPDGKELPESPVDESRARHDASQAPGHLLVFADADFLQDLITRSVFSQAPEAAVAIQKTVLAFVNGLDAVTLGDDLVRIRRPILRDTTVRTKEAEEDRLSILWWGVGFGPLLVLALGILRWALRTAVTTVPSPVRIHRAEGLVPAEPPAPGATGGSAEEAKP